MRLPDYVLNPPFLMGSRYQLCKIVPGDAYVVIINEIATWFYDLELVEEFADVPQDIPEQWGLKACHVYKQKIFYYLKD